MLKIVADRYTVAARKKPDIERWYMTLGNVVERVLVIGGEGFSFKENILR